MNYILQKSEIKLEELCRTCLSKETELVPVFDVCLGAVTLDQAIAAVTGVKIEIGDGLPSTICRDCKEKAANAFEFKCRTVEAEGALRGLYSVVKSEEITLNTILQSTSVDVKTEDIPHDTSDHFMDYELDISFEGPSHDAVVSEGRDGEDRGEDQDEEGERGGERDTDCPVCDARFADAAGLTRHVWQRHADLMGPKKRGRPKQLVTSTVLSQMARRARGARRERGERGPRRERGEPEAAGGRACLEACAVCRLVLASKRDLARHMASHAGVKILSCMQCNKMYLRERDYRLHACADAAAAARQRENEPADAEAQQKPPGAACELLLEDLLQQHRGTGAGEAGEAGAEGEVGEGGEVQVCAACGGVFLSGAALAAHRAADHAALSARCPHCQKVFQSARGAARHQQACARVERRHACGACGARFQHAISLNKHVLRLHAGAPVAVHRKEAPGDAQLNNDKCFECDVCQKKFYRRSNMKSHMRTHEPRAAGAGAGGAGGAASAGGAGLCLYCGRSFSNSSNLIVHMRRHTGEKPYKCDFCGKGFPRSSDLQCHRRSHTGEKPCVCGVCGKGFSRSNKLSRHMRVHTGLKPYKCTYCERAFSQSNDLTLHVRRHTGDKPYVCELCGERFIQGTALHNHRRAHGHYPTQADEPTNAERGGLPPARPAPPALELQYPPPALAN